MSKRYYTVVFEITNEEAWKQYGTQFSQSLADEQPLHHGVQVVSCGDGDIMTGYDALDDQLTVLGYNPDDVVREFCEEHDLDADATIG